ncbi:MAG: hypothetical protein ACRC5C_00500 [Bacilli bacterium]
MSQQSNTKQSKPLVSEMAFKYNVPFHFTQDKKYIRHHSSEQQANRNTVEETDKVEKINSISSELLTELEMDSDCSTNAWMPNGNVRKTVETRTENQGLERDERTYIEFEHSVEKPVIILHENLLPIQDVLALLQHHVTAEQPEVFEQHWTSIIDALHGPVLNFDKDGEDDAYDWDGK